MRLLIVDDEASIRDGLVETIDWRSIGIDSVSSAKNGIEAMKYVRQSAPDILLTDIRMPGMDGLELAECVSRLYPKTKILLLSGYADFFYAKQAISIGVEEYLVKPVNIEELIDKIRVIVEEMKQIDSKATLQPSADVTFTIVKILKTPSLAKEDISLLVRSIGFRWEYPYLLVGIADLSLSESDLEAKSTQLDASEIRSILSGALPAETIYVSEDKTNRSLLFVNLSSAAEAALIENAISSSTDIVSRKYDQQVTLAFSGTFPAFSFREAFQDAERTLRYRFFIGNGITLISRQFSQKRFEHPIPPESIREDLDEAIHSVNTEDCLNLMQPLFQSYRFSNIADIETIQEFCLQLVTILSTQISDREDIGNNLLHLGYVQYVKHFTTVEEYICQVETFYCDILAIIQQNQPSKSKWIVKRAKEFMEQNYTLSLSVEQIAEQVERNPSYLCHIFNSTEGIPITEYLNKLRVKKAKELLRGTSMMSYEVADHVGFKNYRYFTQIFKKYTGISPTAFRNKQET